MSDDLKHICSMIEASAMSDAEKAQWLRDVAILPDFTLAEMREGLEAYPQLLEWFSENRNMKEAALREGKKLSDGEIIHKERQAIEQLIARLNPTV